MAAPIVTPQGLTLKQELFAQEFVRNGGNSSAAYRTAYNCDNSSDETVRVNSHDVLCNTNVTARVQQLIENQVRSTGVTEDGIVSQLAAMAFGDIRDTVSWRNGSVTLKDSTELTASQVAPVKAIKQSKDGVTITFEDKQRALELLGKHIGMWPNKSEVSVTGTVTHQLSEASVDELRTMLEDVRRQKMALSDTMGPVIEGEARELDAGS